MPVRDLDALDPTLREKGRAALAGLPARAERLLAGGARHRELGRLVRDAVIGEAHGEPALLDQAWAALEALAALQLPSGTFASGDNVDSPPDTAFTVGDLAWAASMLRRESSLRLTALQGQLEQLLARTAPALVAGGVHTPNHRFEISAALARLGRLLEDPRCTARAEQWLAEGVDLQADGLFSERSPNYAVHVSIPCLLVLAHELDRPDLADAADAATRAQARLTDARGMVETLGSRRQDRRTLFDGGPLHPLLRAHAIRTGDPLTARAALRTQDRADELAALEVLALGLEDPAVLGPLPDPAADPGPEQPEVHVLAESGLVVVDHGVSRAVIHGGTDTAELGRVSSGASDDPTFLRLAGRAVRLTDLRISRDFFSLGPVRFERPVDSAAVAADATAHGAGAGAGAGAGDGAGTDAGADARHAGTDAAAGPWRLRERAVGEYFHPLAAEDRRADGAYALEFNGRFAAAMSFSSRDVDEVALETAAEVRLGPAHAELDLRAEGPAAALCLLLALEGGRLEGVAADAAGRSIPAIGPDGVGRCRYVGADGETLRLEVHGMADSPAFYEPGEAYTVLGGTDLPGGDHLFIPATTAQRLRLVLDL
ncbi:hypothetical protein [Brachybacterium phenoliresistens]|uniref:hypothetical protein n=1 Tax=Brachybacterium phenoliresistens TaxID=396014 RepID=UPI0031D91D63